MKNGNVIIRPILTEKASDQVKRNIYSFEVNLDAEKKQISTAVSRIYGVTVAEVRTIRRKGKIKRVGKRMKEQKIKDQKIALVHVTKGKIDIFPQT